MSDAEDPAAPAPRACPDAGCGGVLDDQGYCSRCGEPPQADPASEATPDPWGERQLCPDGSCTGVLDEQGRCPECGEAAPGVVAPDADADDPGEAAACADAPSVRDGDDPWTARRLCPDGGCVGVLGGDGRCPVCGRSDAPTVGADAESAAS